MWIKSGENRIKGLGIVFGIKELGIRLNKRLIEKAEKRIDRK